MYKQFQDVLESYVDKHFEGVLEGGERTEIYYQEDQKHLPNPPIIVVAYQNNDWKRVTTYHVSGIVEETFVPPTR